MFSAVPSGDEDPGGLRKPDTSPPGTRVDMSDRCAAAGVLLVVVAGLSPTHWYPGVALFLGLALIAVAHVLAPCETRISQWRKGRREKFDRAQG